MQITRYFNHEKLDVYQEAILFVAWADELTGVMTGKSEGMRYTAYCWVMPEWPAR